MIKLIIKATVYKWVYIHSLFEHLFYSCHTYFKEIPSPILKFLFFVEDETPTY